MACRAGGRRVTGAAARVMERDVRDRRRGSADAPGAVPDSGPYPALRLAVRASAEGVERIGLPATAVLGQHQLPGQAFVERVSLQASPRAPPAAHRAVLRAAPRRCDPRPPKAARPQAQSARRLSTGCRERRTARHATAVSHARTTPRPREGSAVARAWATKSRNRYRSIDNGSAVSV